MPPKSGKKGKPQVELGRALEKSRNKSRHETPSNKHSLKHVSDLLGNNTKAESRIDSIVERSDLEEFIDTALMSQRDFTAARGEAVLIGNIGDPTVHDPSASLENFDEIYDFKDLPIPRRPAWDENTTSEQLDSNEREAFLEWRRKLALIEEGSKMVMTPFEKNLDVWRQLWRVIERSDVVVQIVDARNPLLFRCQDLERYVSEIDSSKKQLLLVNKADFLSDHMRKCWADHFESIGVRYAFCSAMIDNSRIREEKEKAQEESPYESDEKETKIPVTIARKKEYFDRYRILATYEVMDLFRSIYFDFDDSKDDNRSIVVGLVGYPNVGKSSTINALCGEKRVGVAAMPGKTRHFQTIVLGNLTLCDCPGLVFPTFMNTKAGLICNGILPIDRMRDCIGPVQWLCNRVAGKQLEETYSIKLNGKERGLSAHHVLEEYARMRGFMAASGRPDEARGSRVILKDFNKGKILYCHPPPNLSEEQREYFFNSMEKTSIIHLTEEETAENERRELTNDNIMHQMLKKDHGSSSGPVEHSGMAGKKLSRREKARAKANAKKGMELGQKYRRTQQIGGYEIEE